MFANKKDVVHMCYKKCELTFVNAESIITEQCYSEYSKSLYSEICAEQYICVGIEIYFVSLLLQLQLRVV